MFKLCSSKKTKSKVIVDRVQQSWNRIFDPTKRLNEPVDFISVVEADELWASCNIQAQNLRSESDVLGVIGIGGSALGAQVVYESLGSKLDSKVASGINQGIKQILFFDNIDAESFWQKINGIENLKKIHWLVVSKSGSTMETLIQAQLIDQHYRSKGLNFAQFASLVTESRESPLTQWLGGKVRHQHEIPLGVGGRFSVLTAVGLVPAAYLGHSIDEIRQGARWALDQKSLICDFVAESLSSFERQEWITLFWSYSDRLKYFGSWVQQLWAESLAKKENLSGGPGPRVSSPIPCIGAIDQHSILQQVIAGAKDKFIVFHRVGGAENFGPKLLEDSVDLGFSFEGRGIGDLMQAEVLATQEALCNEGIPFVELVIDDLSPRSLGSLFMFYELVIAVLGGALDINPFDQPEVEQGKRFTKDRLRVCQRIT